MSQWFAKNQFVVVAVCVLMIGAAVAFSVRSMRSPDDVISDAELTWYMDLGSGELFAASQAAIPPIAAPSNQSDPQGEPAGVRAYVFSCSSCSDTTSRFVGYVEKYHPDIQKALSQYSPQVLAEMPTSARAELGVSIEAIEYGRFVAQPRDTATVAEWEWFPVGDRRGMSVMQDATGRCTGGTVQLCGVSTGGN